MQIKELTAGPPRQFAVVLDEGDEAMACLLAFAQRHDVTAGAFTGIGALHRATLAFFDPESRVYANIPVEEQVEVVAFSGDFATTDGKAKLHAHAVLSKRDGSTVGGHLVEAHVRPTLEVIVTDAPTHLERVFDPTKGLALLKL